MNLLLVNGPNLNLLGTREPIKYGKESLSAIEIKLTEIAKEKKFKLICFQSNSEGDLINFIHKEGPQAKGMIFNPGAYTHTSIALRDAILAVNLNFIELHITNVFRREAFRHQSYFKDIALGQIVGLGIRGYFLALDCLMDMIEQKEL